ncbi:GH-E family nuclease, partial [Fusobacterium sp.]|uniref:GH-E family nuclease n=1 Tax=Fusobacterium sp. TaxID=68766 RepID=UPI0029045749
YDKDEKTADNVGNKIEEIKAGEEKDYNEYLASIKDKYKDLPSLEESKELENRIPDEYKENLALTTTIIIGGVVLIGSYYSGQKTEEYLNSEEGKRAWSKFEEDLKEEWEAKKNKGIAYAEFYQASLETFLTDKIGIKDIAIGTGKGIDDTLTFPGSKPVELPTHTGNTGKLPEEILILPPTSLDDGKEFERPMVDPLPEAKDKDDLTTADKNPPKLNNNHIYFITAEGTLEVKNTDMPKDYTLNEDGTVVGPKGGEYKQAGYTEDGKVIFVNNKEFFLFEGGEKKAVSSPGTGGIIQTGLTRPPLTKATKDKITARYTDNGDGTFTYNETDEIIQGPIDYGHIYSWENRRLIKAAESLGMDQKTFNQYVNSRDNIFQYENHDENVSHKNEKPGNSLEKDIVEDMKNFLKE